MRRQLSLIEVADGELRVTPVRPSRSSRTLQVPLSAVSECRVTGLSLGTVCKMRVHGQRQWADFGVSSRSVHLCASDRDHDTSVVPDRAATARTIRMARALAEALHSHLHRPVPSTAPLAPRPLPV